MAFMSKICFALTLAKCRSLPTRCILAKSMLPSRQALMAFWASHSTNRVFPTRLHASFAEKPSGSGPKQTVPLLSGLNNRGHAGPELCLKQFTCCDVKSTAHHDITGKYGSAHVVPSN